MTTMSTTSTATDRTNQHADGNGRQQSRGRFNTDAVKRAARGRWVEILGNVGGLQAEFLHFNNREGPCPKCQGQTRYRGLDESTGALFCSHCHCEKNGDGIAALMWLRGWTFRQTVAELAKYLGIDTKAGGNGEAKKANSGKAQTAKKKPLTESTDA